MFFIIILYREKIGVEFIMSTGRLQINVFEETFGKPIKNAKVQISESKSPENILEEVITDISGKSDIVNLNSPPLEYSLQVNEPLPYGEYNITVTNEDFDTIKIEKIQVLPDTIADQNVFMQKKLNNIDDTSTFLISEHTLYKNYPPKISEASVKELPSASGFVVLDKIVGPEYIVVHDGDPNDNNVPNYWVPYKEYIKNVASSEIYATWPEEAIKANILAINSFVLNRVYTEWYRSRGKNFTITSTTSYDQKFIYQRNVFREISVIVDELFSTYITKPNIKQPLFTQFCDGKNVSCPQWLSQWGSKELAENGSNYLDILRYYYGSEIYLDVAPQISGVPVSFPGETLQSGSTGNSVRTIQQQLNSISKNYPAINKLIVDGIYGDKTVNSVKQFQEIFNMPQSGIVDYATWYEISKIYTAVERLS